MHGPLSLIGTLVVCAGLNLLWLSRREILYRTGSWLNIVRAFLRGSQHPAERMQKHSGDFRFGSGREHILRLVLGLSLVLVVGPVFIVLGLTP